MVVDELLSPEEARFVDVARVAHVATVDAAGEPHVVPVSTIVDNGLIVFASDIATRKIRNLEGDPHCAIVFDDYLEDWTALRQVLVHGRARLVDADTEFDRLRTLLYEKYRQYEAEAPIEDGTATMVVVELERASSWGFPDAADAVIDEFDEAIT